MLAFIVAGTAWSYAESREVERRAFVSTPEHVEAAWPVAPALPAPSSSKVERRPVEPPQATPTVTLLDVEPEPLGELQVPKSEEAPPVVGRARTPDQPIALGASIQAATTIPDEDFDFGI